MDIKAKVYKNNSDSKLKASASITLNDLFVVTGLKVIEGSNGLFVAMPNRKDNNDEWKDTCFPLNKELRDEINKVVLAEYNK